MAVLDSRDDRHIIHNSINRGETGVVTCTVYFIMCISIYFLACQTLSHNCSEMFFHIVYFEWIFYIKHFSSTV